jgi:hypothetical protein
MKTVELYTDGEGRFAASMIKTVRLAAGAATAGHGTQAPSGELRMDT